MLYFTDIFSIDWIDVVDFALVLLLLFQVYKLVRGTMALRILFGAFAIYAIWKLVAFFQLNLLSEILGQFIGVGVLALIIVFQQEIRKLLLMVGTQSFGGRRQLTSWLRKKHPTTHVHLYAKVFKSTFAKFSKERTGCLVLIENIHELGEVKQSGVAIDARLSEKLLDAIFQKFSPLHDGAVILQGKRISHASCILPMTVKRDLPQDFGTRHLAALGVSETTDAMVWVVSEETGDISMALRGNMKHRIDIDDVEEILTTQLKKRSMPESSAPETK